MVQIRAAHRRREGTAKIKYKKKENKRKSVFSYTAESHCNKANPPRITHRLLIASVSHRDNSTASVLTAKPSAANSRAAED